MPSSIINLSSGESRLASNKELTESGPDAAREKCQRDYRKGQNQKGKIFAVHETKVQLTDVVRC